MLMILQTGMRTDIPAFYSEWFINRLKEGYVMVRNPYYPKNIIRYELNPNVVDCIGFCTKNPHPMLKYMDYLKDYGQYWFITITPYGKDIEPNVGNKHQIIEDFKELSKIVGIDSIGWRYDPIFINEKYTMEYHIHAFETICKELCCYTNTCVISFIDLYKKVLKNFSSVKEVSMENQLYLGKKFIEIGNKYSMTIKPCAEGDFLEKYGANCSGCMTQDVYEKAIHSSLKIPKKKSARNECHCLLGNDIGSYNTCMHLCKYCYANYSKELVIENYKNHDVHSPLLIGHINKDDIIKNAKQESWKEITLF